MNLYYNILCPFSRSVRVILSECEIEFNSIIIGNINDSKSIDLTPILELKSSKDNIEIIGIYSIIEYISEVSEIFSKNLQERSNTRTLCEIFNNHFYYKVLQPIINERIVKYYEDRSIPESKILFQNKKSAIEYFQMINDILEKKSCITGDTLSIADFCIASHISCLDYMGYIQWSNFNFMKKWYSRVKSRSSFRNLLSEKIPFISPPSHYSILDF